MSKKFDLKGVGSVSTSVEAGQPSEIQGTHLLVVPTMGMVTRAHACQPRWPCLGAK